MPIATRLPYCLLLDTFHHAHAHGKQAGEQNCGQGYGNNGNQVTGFSGCKAFDCQIIDCFFIVHITHENHRLQPCRPQYERCGRQAALIPRYE